MRKLSPLTLLAFFTACAEEAEIDSPVPAYNVSYSCNINTINAAMGHADLPNLDCQPGVVLIDQYLNTSDNIGVCGLLLYHATFEDAFYAFDLACPYCYSHNKTQAITMQDPFVAVCPACSSSFGLVQYGSAAPTAGPANAESLYLRTYRAFLVNYNTLVVTRR